MTLSYMGEGWDFERNASYDPSNSRSACILHVQHVACSRNSNRCDLFVVRCIGDVAEILAASQILPAVLTKRFRFRFRHKP